MKSLRHHCALIPASTGRKLAKGILAVCCAGSLGLGVGNARAEAQFGGEFWISTNATSMIYSGGVVYSNGVPVVGGTLDNPLDGSSQTNLDQNLNNLPADATIHLLAGLYHTAGFYGGSSWIMKSGQKIVGSGIDQTILQLPGTYTGGQVFVIRSVAGTNMVVSDLTCDANGAAGTVYHEGVELTGSQCTVSHIKVINCSSTSNEVFGIGIESSGAADNSYRNVIEDCEVSHYLGGSGITAIQLAGPLSGVVRYNHVYLPSIQGSSYFGINIANVHDVIIEGNFVSGAECGIYCDSGGITNVLVAHNTLSDCNGGIVWGNYNTWVNDTIAFNNIEITNLSSETPAIYLQPGSTGTNINIMGNIVHYLGEVSPFGPYDTAPKFVQAYGITGLNVANNTVQAGLTNIIGGGSNDCYNVNFFNNYDLYGNPLADGNNTIGAYPISETGYALLGSTNSAQVLTNLGLPASPAIILTNTQIGVSLNGTFNGTNSGTFTGNGGGLTNLSASTITSGLLSAAVLPTNGVWNTTLAFTNMGSQEVQGNLSINNPSIVSPSLRMDFFMATDEWDSAQPAGYITLNETGRRLFVGSPSAKISTLDLENVNYGEGFPGFSLNQQGYYSTPGDSWSFIATQSGVPYLSLIASSVGGYITGQRSTDSYAFGSRSLAFMTFSDTNDNGGYHIGAQYVFNTAVSAPAWFSGQKYWSWQINGAEVASISNNASWYLSAPTLTVTGTVMAASVSVNSTFLSTNAVCPSPLAGGGWLWNSNNAIYWVTASHTNYIAGP